MPLPLDRVLMNIQANSGSFLDTVAAALITGPGLFCPQRPGGHFRGQSEVQVSQPFLPSFLPPTTTSSIQFVCDDTQD